MNPYLVFAVVVVMLFAAVFYGVTYRIKSTAARWGVSIAAAIVSFVLLVILFMAAGGLGRNV